VIYGERIDAYR